MTYAVIVNAPGYLPDTVDDVDTYDNLLDARGAFAGALDALGDDGYIVRWQGRDYARLQRASDERDADDLGLEVEIVHAA